MQKQIDSIIGDQVQSSGEDLAVHFMITKRVPIKGTFNSRIVTYIQRVSLSHTKYYDTPEELLADKNIIPNNFKKFSINELKQHVAIDTGMGAGTELNELDIVAFVNNSSFVMTKPIAKVMLSDGRIVYVPSPIINQMVKNIK